MNKKRLFFIALAVFVLDRVTKLLFAAADFTVIPGILGFHATENTGMAFGMLSGGGVLLILLSAMALTALFLLLRKYALSAPAQWGLGLLLGGAAGNLFDRVAYGHVIDFIDMLFLDWFVFNIADIGVTVGAALLALCIFLGKDTKDA